MLSLSSHCMRVALLINLCISNVLVLTFGRPLTRHDEVCQSKKDPAGLGLVALEEPDSADCKGWQGEE